MPGLYWKEPIHSALLDHTTIVKNHNVYTHLGCVILRCTIGLALILYQSKLIDVDSKIRYLLMAFCALVVLLFGYKYHKFIQSDVVVWKSYLRTIVAYSFAGGLIYNKRFDSAGIVMIADALMGLQSRHLSHTMSYLHDLI